MNLTKLCLLLGIGYGVLNVAAFLKPAASIRWLRRFPRHVPWGIALSLVATAWFEYLLVTETISDFKEWKPMLAGLFAFGGIGACFFLQDYLSIRALSALMLLVAQVMVDTQRWHPSPFKNVVTVWAYVFVVLGMWWVVSPWRARDWIQWNTADEARFRKLSLGRAVFGFGVAALGVTILG